MLTRIPVLIFATMVVTMMGQIPDSDKKVFTPEELLRSYGVALETPSLVEALSNPQAIVRQNAALLLGRRKDTAVIPELKKHLNDEFPYARLAVAGALVQLGDQSGNAVLMEALADQNPGSAIYAAAALEQMGNSAGFRAIAKIAAEAKEPLDRLQATRALGKYLKHRDTEQAAVTELIARLSKDGDKRVREVAADELQHQDRTDVAAAFTAASKDKDELVRAIAESYLAARQQRRPRLDH